MNISKKINEKLQVCLTRQGVTLIAAAFAALLLIIAVLLALNPAVRRTVTGAGSETTVAVKSGDTLSTILADHKLSGNEINEIAAILKKDCGVNGLRADADKLIVKKPNANAAVDKIILVSGPWKRVELTCDNGGKWAAETIDIARDVRMVYKTGKINEGDSFYGAGLRAGIPAGVLADVYDLLSFEIDFERDVREGQEFAVLYEEHFASGEKAGNGAVVALSFDALRGNVKMFRFKRANGTFGYYDEAGNGATKALKRTPINNARVSSSFNPNRKHPVLGYTRAHKGVDFRASSGTPIPAAGAGRVIARSYNRGHGNFVKIRHNGSFETLYAHMSRFQSGVTVGTNVRQGQIIGYVGSTGISTGPHLHYEIIKNGTHVNPMTVKFPAIDNLDARSKPKFQRLREQMERAIAVLESNPGLYVQM